MSFPSFVDSESQETLTVPPPSREDIHPEPSYQAPCACPRCTSEEYISGRDTSDDSKSFSTHNIYWINPSESSLAIQGDSAPVYLLEDGCTLDDLIEALGGWGDREDHSGYDDPEEEYDYQKGWYECQCGCGYRYYYDEAKQQWFYDPVDRQQKEYSIEEEKEGDADEWEDCDSSSEDGQPCILKYWDRDGDYEGYDDWMPRNDNECSVEDKMDFDIDEIVHPFIVKCETSTCSSDLVGEFLRSMDAKREHVDHIHNFCK
ncbi:hypothetical protein ABKN59_000650 [Abortiporus biennis]